MKSIGFFFEATVSSFFLYRVALIIITGIGDAFFLSGLQGNHLPGVFPQLPCITGVLH